MAIEDIKLGDLTTKQYLEEYVKQEVEKAVAALKKELAPVVPIVIPPDCKKGPIIGPVIIIGKLQAQVWFDGEEVFRAIITIIDSTGNVVNTPEEFEPENNHPIVLLKENFRNETYTATMVATSCTGKSSYTFNGITGLPGKSQGDDVVVKPDPCKEIGKITKVEIR